MYTTATLKSKRPDGAGTNRLVVVYSGDQGELAERVYLVDSSVDNEWLRRRAIADIDSLNGGLDFAKKLVEGDIDLTPITPPAPTQAELDQQKFLVDYTRLQQLNKLVVQDVLNTADKLVVDQLALVKGEFKSEYF